MDIPQVFVRNKIISIISIFLTVVVCITGIAYYLISGTNTSENKSATKKFNANATTSRPESTINSSTTSTLPVSTTTATTTTKPKSVIAAEQTTTTTQPALFVTPTAVLTSQSADICLGGEFNFSGSLHANREGSATYLWIQSSGEDSGVSGAVEFNSNGDLIGSVSSFTISTPPGSIMSGWAALKATWNNGSSTSDHATFYWQYSVGSSIGAQGC